MSCFDKGFFYKTNYKKKGPEKQGRGKSEGMYSMSRQDDDDRLELAML